MNSATTVPRTRTKRRWLRRLALGLALTALVPFATVGIVRWLDDRAWQQACAEADRLDPGWRWDDLPWSKPTGDGPDAEARIEAAAAQLLSGGPNWDVLVRVEDLPSELTAGLTPAEREGWRAILARNFARDVQHVPPNQLLSPWRLPVLRAAVPADVNAAVRRLADFRGGSMPLTERPLLFHLSYHRLARAQGHAFTLKYAALLAAHEDCPDEALHACQALFGAARTANEPPTFRGAILERSLRAAVTVHVEQALALGTPSPRLLEAMGREIADELRRPRLLDVLRSERAIIESLVADIDRGRLTPEQVAQLDGSVQQVTGWPTVNRWLHRMRGNGWDKRLAAEQVGYCTLLIELLRESPDGPRQATNSVGAASARLSAAVRSWADNAGPNSVVERDRLARAFLASTLAALAAERFRQQHNRWPVSLDELVPRYLQTVPTDPYDLRPLKVNRREDGIVIYSVSQDNTDDGGAIRVEPGQAGTPADVGIRLWDPAERRRPPKSENGVP